MIKALYQKFRWNFIHDCWPKGNYGGIRNVNAENAKMILADMIDSGKPFALARIGFGEIDFLYEIMEKDRHNKPLNDFKHAGLEDVMGYDANQIRRYEKLLSDSYKDIDIFACWYRSFHEAYLMRKLAKRGAIGTDERVLECFLDKEKSWVQKLAGKKVLVVTAFACTTEQQYQKRLDIYPNGFLPEFELKTFQSVWYDNDAGKDDRFPTWFDALNYMIQEIDKIDYDIALLGCGAFGTPIVSHMKRQGKQAIYVGGILQLMFGIRGSRWDDPSYSAYHSLFNEHWVYPGDDNKPVNANKLEGGCFW